MNNGRVSTTLYRALSDENATSAPYREQSIKIVYSHCDEKPYQEKEAPNARLETGDCITGLEVQTTTEDAQDACYADMRHEEA